MFEFKKSQLVIIWLILILPLIFSTTNPFQLSQSKSYEKFTFLKPSNSKILTYPVENDVSHVSISSTGQYFVACSNNKVYYFNKDIKSPLWNYSAGSEGNSMRFAKISSDGKHILTGGDTGRVYLFQNESSNPLWYYYVSETWMEPLAGAISSDGTYIVMGSGTHMYTTNITGHVFLFNKTSSIPLWNFTIKETILSVDISSDGQYIAAGGRDKKLYFFNRTNSNPLWTYQTEGFIWSVAISNDGKFVAVGSDDDKVYLFNRKSNNTIWNFTTPNEVRTVAISFNGHRVVAGTYWNPAIFYFNNKNPDPIWSYSPDYSVRKVIISSNGNYFAFRTYNEVYFFSNSSNSPAWSYKTGDYISDISMSSEGDYILLGSNKVYLLPRNLPRPPDLRIFGLIIIGVVGAGVGITFIYFLHLSLFRKDKKPISK
jgi:outer membrane protein assembly factor BamB